MFFNNCSNLRILIFLQLWFLNIFQQLVLSVKNVAYRRQETNMTVTRFYTHSNQSLHAIITTETDKMQTHANNNHHLRTTYQARHLHYILTDQKSINPAAPPKYIICPFHSQSVTCLITCLSFSLPHISVSKH